MTELTGRKIPPKLENPIDNILILVGNKLGTLFHKIPFMTPNIITTMSLVVTLVGCWFLFKEQYRTGAILIFIGYFFDCMDGNFARTYNMVSTNGDLYDHVSDLFKHIIISAVIYQSPLSKQTFRFFMLITVVFTVMILVHAGCQEQNKDAKYIETTVLSYAKPFCLSKEWIHITRWGGFGTVYLLGCAIIYNLPRIDDKLKSI